MSEFSPIGSPTSSDEVETQGESTLQAKSPSFWANNPFPQSAPGANAVKGHIVDNGIPLSIFPISQNKLCLCVCGLPARGKTDISRRLVRYLSFFHALEVSTFDVAEYRRRRHRETETGTESETETETEDNASSTHSRLPLFSSSTYPSRESSYDSALSEMRSFFQSHPDGVAILDAICPTHEWRLKVKTAVQQMGVKLVFIEVQNNDTDFLATQVDLIATHSPDYSEAASTAEAAEDVRARMKSYEESYEKIGKSDHEVEKKWSFFTCDHSRKRFVTHNVTGHIPLKVINFIMNLRTTTHSFYLTRHGQSEYNVVGRIGGDSGLSDDHGMNYARKLADFVEKKVKKDESGRVVPARLFTSTMRRTIETAQFIRTETVSVKDEWDDSVEYEW